MKKRSIIILGVIVLIAVLLVGFNIFRSAMMEAYFADMERPPVTVSAATARSMTWTPGISAVGTAKAAQGVDVAVEVSGIVEEIAFEANQQVAAGDVLVRIDAAIEQAEMIAAQANIKLYETELERIRALRSKGFSTEANLDEALARLEVARSDLARLEAVTEQKVIAAPFSGIVGIPQIDLGEHVQPGAVVVTLQDLDSMRVDFTIPEQSVQLLRLGQPVRVTTESVRQVFPGEIIGIDPKIDPQTRLVSVRAQVDNPGRRLLPGQFLRVRVELPPEDGVIAVPQTAVVPSLYGDHVYVIDETEGGLVARQVFVTVGRRNDGLSEIVNGLEPGMRVVAAGQNKLQNGARVVVDNSVALPGMEPSAEGKPGGGAP